MALIDLSHPLEDGVHTYPNLPAPKISDYRTHAETAPDYAPGVGFHFGKVEMLGNTGTWVDAPYHRYEDGADLAELPLERLADLDALVLRPDLSRGPAIGPELFRGQRLRGRAVLVVTGWSRHWATPTYAAGGHPFLTRAAAEALLEGGCAFLGVDALNVDDTDDGERPVHSLLLAEGVPIGEHFTNLDALPTEGARLHAAPVKARGLGTFPVRAYAVLR
ncbi:MAG: cyclase family protein [Planctomycetota bacterium]